MSFLLPLTHEPRTSKDTNILHFRTPSSYHGYNKKSVVHNTLQVEAGDQTEHGKKLAQSINRCKDNIQTCLKKKKERSIKVINFTDLPPPPGASESASVKKCQAVTQMNKPCPFRATQGKFCKKHQIVDTV
jgi:hypothetical protein